MSKAPSPRKHQPRRLPARKGSAAHGLNASARALVEAMVWDALDRNAAAAKVGITEDYAYRLLRDPAVMAWYRTEVAAIRRYGQAHLVHRLEALVDQDDNLTAVVGAAKVLLSMDGPTVARGGGLAVNVITPGYVIDCTEALARGRPEPAGPGAKAGYVIDASAFLAPGEGCGE